MSEWKEVWHVWDEDIEKLRSIHRFLLSDGSEYLHLYTAECYPLHAVAYTTGKKRRRVECGKCKNNSHIVWVYCGGYLEYRGCLLCGGTGKVWEYTP